VSGFNELLLRVRGDETTLAENAKLRNCENSRKLARESRRSPCRLDRPPPLELFNPPPPTPKPTRSVSTRRWWRDGGR